LCNGERVNIRYPIDEEYLSRHTGLALDNKAMGVAIRGDYGHQFIYPSPKKKILSLFYRSYMSSAKNGFYQARKEEEIPVVFRDYYESWIEK